MSDGLLALRRFSVRRSWLALATIAAVLALSALLGMRASVMWLGLLVAGLSGLILLQRPVLSLLALVAAALVLPLKIGTGTEVKINPATLLIPAVLALWLLGMILRRDLHLAAARVNRPLLLFLLAGLLSLGVGNATWDLTVPRVGNFLLVQLAQWAIFAFSAGALWLTGNLVKDEVWLRRLTWAFLILAGGMALPRLLPGAGAFADRFATIAFTRAPLWTLLAALTAGQLLFNAGLRPLARIFLASVLVACVAYAFFEQREAASAWVGIGTALGVLAWLRFPRLRWLLIALVVALVLIGILFPAIYNFAGGDQEWATSGGSRLVLAQRVIEVTLRNPITGLGPAAYRPYANMKPLPYQGAYWIAPQINSHNNYVDLFAHVGLLGLGLFLWFAVELGLLGWRLSQRYRTGFLAGYANGILAAWVGSLVIMALADWMLPFVYNIGFEGFQASVLVWLFLGGLVSLEQIAGHQNGDHQP
ncbi:MAG: O-antigen ligase family protein [Chloroflexi bacterium]|nr:O-antigen ligase family protein [Chloroflexota bacterium]